CFRVPLANGIKLSLARQFFLGDLPLFAPLIALGLLLPFANRRFCVRSVRNEGESEARHRAHDAVLTAMTFMGILGSLLSRAHWGGAENVLMTAYLFLAASVSILAGRWQRENLGARVPMYALVLAQLLTLTYRPDLQLPKAANREAGERYQAAIRQL